MVNLFSLVLISTWIAVVILSAVFLKIFIGDKKELSRKIVHIGIGPLLPIAWWLNINANTAISIASIITIALIINYRFQLIPIFEDVERKSFGTIAYGISITFLIILFWSTRPDCVCAGVLVMAFGDGFAGLIGKQVKSPNWTVLGQKKSIAGTSAMGLITLAILIILSTINGNLLNPLGIFAISLLATGLEQISPLGIDNLSVPIGVAIGWQLIVGKI